MFVSDHLYIPLQGVACCCVGDVFVSPKAAFSCSIFAVAGVVPGGSVGGVSCWCCVYSWRWLVGAVVLCGCGLLVFSDSCLWRIFYIMVSATVSRVEACIFCPSIEARVLAKVRKRSFKSVLVKVSGASSCSCICVVDDVGGYSFPRAAWVSGLCHGLP